MVSFNNFNNQAKEPALHGSSTCISSSDSYKYMPKETKK